MSILSKMYNYFSNKRKIKSIGKIASSAIINGTSIFGKVNIGENAIINDAHLVGEISIGDYTSIFGPNTQIYSKLNPIIIGKFCSIARSVTLQNYNHNVNTLSTSMINSKLFDFEMLVDINSESIIVENDVWIGSHVVVLSGVTIGNGAIIGANSTVTKDIPAYSIAVGSPAKVVKYRFTENVIDMLLQLKWWDKPIEWIHKNKYAFSERPLTEATLSKLLDEC